MLDLTPEDVIAWAFLRAHGRVRDVQHLFSGDVYCGPLYFEIQYEYERADRRDYEVMRRGQVLRTILGYGTWIKVQTMSGPILAGGEHSWWFPFYF